MEIYVATCISEKTLEKLKKKGVVEVKKMDEVIEEAIEEIRKYRPYNSKAPRPTLPGG
ncbi:MAG: hypothetical protein ACPL07_00625 [Candidatus Bathyarchaeia archaeon]